MAKKTSRRRKQSEDRIGILIIGVLTVAIAVALGALFVATRGTESVDAATGCGKGAPPSITVVVLDITDPLGPVQKPKVRNLVEEEKAALPKGGRLDVYTVARIASEPLVAQFSACNPGTSAQITNQLTENPRQVEKRWQNFSGRMAAVLNRIEQESAQNESPIIQSVNSASATSFGPFHGQSVHKRLVLVSDLMQHGQDTSFFKAIPTLNEFRKTGFYQKNRPDLEGVDVRLGVLARGNLTEDKAKTLVNFWAALLNDSGGDLALYQWISG